MSRQGTTPAAERGRAAILARLRADHPHADGDPVGRALLGLAADFAEQAGEAEARALAAFERGAGRHGMTWHTIAQTWRAAGRAAERAVPPYDAPRCPSCGDLLWPGDRCDHTGTGADRAVPFTVACPPCGLASGPLAGGEPDAVQHAGTHDDLNHGGRPATDVEPMTGRDVA